MEDRCLFKAKRYTDSCYINQRNSTGLGFSEFIEVDGETICRCTGWKDKKGRLFWEHDVVGRLEIHKVDEPTVGVIEYDIENTAFIIHWLDKPKYSAVFPWKEKIQVIGNEFDNLKLSESESYMNKKEEINNYNKIRLKKRADPKRKARIINRLLKADFFKERQSTMEEITLITVLTDYEKTYEIKNNNKKTTKAREK